MGAQASAPVHLSLIDSEPDSDSAWSSRKFDVIGNLPTTAGLTAASLAGRLVRELATIATTSWAYLLVTKPLQPTASPLLDCAPHPIGTTNGTPDGSEKDEQTDGGNHRGYPGVNADLPVRHPMKEPPRHYVNDYGQHDPNVSGAQLPSLVRSIYQWAVFEHLPPSEGEWLRTISPSLTESAPNYRRMQPSPVPAVAIFGGRFGRSTASGRPTPPVRRADL